MAKMEDDLVTHAKKIIDVSGRPSQICLRRSISSSYYSVWHCICAAIANKFAFSHRRQVARIPEHKTVKTAAGKLKGHSNTWLSNACCGRISQLCEDFICLQEERHAADYDIARNFQKQDALIAIQRAEWLCSSVTWAQFHCGDELDAFLSVCLGIKNPNRP